MFPHRNIHKYTWTSPDGKTMRGISWVAQDVLASQEGLYSME
jgi:hypothetical protein